MTLPSEIIDIAKTEVVSRADRLNDDQPFLNMTDTQRFSSIKLNMRAW